MASEDKIFITGVAGIFPKLNNVDELYAAIANKKQMLSSIDSSWKIIASKLASNIGKQPLDEKFDAGFFGVHHKLAEGMHQSTRRLLEISVEAIMDAGLNPSDLKGSNTAVFVATSHVDCDRECMTQEFASPNFGIIGSLRSSLSECISYHLQLQGPSNTFDTACSSSFHALGCAVQALKTGRCNNALVCGVNILQNPYVQLGYENLNVLDLNGQSNVFDESCTGFSRSEATVAILLQKSQNSKRMYAEILGITSNSDGFKEAGLTFPSSEAMAHVFRDVYKYSNVDPLDVSFVECHITGTAAGFTEELKAVENVFCTGRQLPLFVGSVKANVGHAESVSGLISIIKVLLGLQQNCILPNPDCYKINLRAEALRNGKLKVATDCIFLPKDKNVIIGCNNFGFGGSNAHVALKHHHKIPVAKSKFYPKRLVCFSARTKESLTKIAASFKDNSTEEYLMLLQNIFRYNVYNYNYRGFVILNHQNELEISSFNHCREKLRLCLVFPGLTIPLWPFLQEIQQNKALLESFKKICDILQGKNEIPLNLWDPNKDLDYGERILAIIIFQLTVVDALKNILQQQIDVVESCCSGVIAAAFALETLSLENSIMLAYKLSSKLNAGTKYDNCSFLNCQNPIKQIVLKELEMVCLGTNTKFMKECSSNQVKVVVGFNQNYGDFSYRQNTSWLQILGRLYTLGFDLHLEKMCLNFAGPVKAPLISPLIEWDHTDNWHVLKYQHKDLHKMRVTISLENKEWNFLSGHVLDGRNLVAASVYLVIVWESYLQINGLSLPKNRIVFENVKFQRTTILLKNKPTVLTIYFTKLQDKFEIMEGSDRIVTGKIRSSQEKLNFCTKSWNLSSNYSNKTMNTEDFYKKLRLHGYNYKNAFCCIQTVNIDVTHAQIKWINWATFLDAMIHLRIFHNGLDTLNVPVEIEQLLIDPQLHAQYLSDKEITYPVYFNKKSNRICAPGIEYGLVLFSNIKRRSERKPCLEVYKFVPFRTELSLEESILINVQIVTENVDNHISVVEIVDSFSNNSDELLCPIIEKISENSFMQIKNLSIYSNKSFEFSNIIVQNKTLEQLSSDINFVILSGGSKRPTALLQILQKDNCFVLSREAGNFNEFEGIEVVSVHRVSVNHESLVLLRLSIGFNKTIVEMDSNLIWLEQLQAALNKNQKVLLVAENSDSGILGLTNCLKQEVGQHVSCLFLTDVERKFIVNDEFYMKQMRKNLLVNVCKSGTWGTYRHLPLSDEKVDYLDAVTLTNSNDFSSVQYVQSKPAKNSFEFEKCLVNVHYAALNFKDVLSTMRVINLSDSIYYESKYETLGYEFAGVDSCGRRLIGILRNNAFSNTICVNKSFTCDIPNEWSMEEAATVPVGYMTVLYGLLKLCRLKRGQSVLIHLGTGGIGQSAINIALHYDCKIFATVGSDEKREYLISVFPMIPKSHIGNSRDLTFEQMILKNTGGKGVDIVINSLIEDQLRAGIRCVARQGTFLDLGKYDQQLNNPLELYTFGNGRSYISFYLDNFFEEDPRIRNELISLLKNGIKEGYVKPLPKTVYDKNRVGDALQYMKLGKHVGKILIKYKDDLVEDETPIKAKPRFFCDPNKVYLLIGGLGGIGIELADWLIERGAHTLILVSRNGVTTGYQQYKLKYWSKRGYRVITTEIDLTSEDGCACLLNKANALGIVDGIFNLSVVLRDALIENQTENHFQTCLAPKAVITKNIDVKSRQFCPNLRYFIVFSSVSCGRGNSGQTNYGMANSIMERICEQRKNDGYPALAIQWGLIGDVGLLGNQPSNIVINGCIQQSIPSCLNVMDTFLCQKEVIVSSLVSDSKKIGQVSKKDNFLDAVANILAISNTNHISTHSTLSSLGMDSTSSVELKQFLSSEHNMFLNIRELQNMTLYMLMNNKIKNLN